VKRFPIKILFNIWADANNTNAQSLNARDIALRLDPTRFESSMFVAGKPDPRLLEHSGIRLIQLPQRLGSVLILAHLVWGKYDILFYQPYPKCTGWYRFLIPMGKRKKLVAPLEGPMENTTAEKVRASRKCLRILAQSDIVVPISEFLKESIEREIGLKSNLCIPVGVDTNFFIPGPRNGSNRVHVIFVGRLIERKGVHIVLEAARIFPDIDFSIVGTSYDREDSIYAADLKRKSIEVCLRNVNFLGKLSQLRLRDLMQTSDILLLPSRIEGIPKITLEAAATGMPCIVFDDYQTPSVLHNVTGFQVKTFEEMVARLRDLIGNRELRLKMGAAGIEHAKKFDWEVIIKQWERVFEETIERRAKVA
jgi:glycosyltransferase involved in cell wall biosynthesis